MPEQQELAPDPDNTIPRLRLSEVGTTGLQVYSKSIVEEANRLFRYPTFLKIVDEMKNNATISAALTGNRMMVGRVKWSVNPPVGADEKMLERTKFIETCMHDMEHTWDSFIADVISCIEYGFAVQEKVFRRRLKANGSKYNDGLVGWKKLPSRSQNTISGWVFSEDGRELVKLEQTISNIDSFQKSKLANPSTGKIEINRDKFLLFTCDSTRGNPEGRSLLKGCYTAYRQLQLIQEQRMIGVARDLGGIPKIGLPPKYMSPDASAEDKAVYDACKIMGENLTTGAQSSVVYPVMYDIETKQPLFTLELLESKGGKAFDTTEIIGQLEKDILRALFWDVLTLTGNTSDNFSTNQGRTNLTALHLGFRLKEIAEVINNDLVRQTFELNGWDAETLPTITFSDFDEIDLESFSKAVQRMAATGMLERDREIFDLIRIRLGVTEKGEGVPIGETTPDTSRTGDSFNTATGGLDGTSNSVSTTDRSAANKDN
jgi:hypothetical protein